MSKHILSLPSIATAVAVILLFTPFYSLSYLIILVLSLKFLPNLPTFSTYVGRFVFASLLLAATIMIVGFGAWVAHIPVHPALTALGYALLLLLLHKSYTGKIGRDVKLFDKSDVISVALSLVAPLVIIASYQLPHPSYAAIYQFLNNGWDNSSHLLMLETTEMENGYLYGPYSELKEKTITQLNAYPQAWHLATAHLFGGFGIKPFDPTHQTRELITYTIAIFTWFMTLVYCFTKVSWRLLRSVLPHIDSASTGLFVTANLALQGVLLWGALTTGFANYLGCMTYLVLLVGIILERDKTNTNSNYLLALLAGTASSLCWFLPLPAIAIMITLAFLYTIKLPFWHIKNYTQRPWYLYVATLLALSLVIGQVAIFVLYSNVSGDKQLNTGRLGGVFEVSQLFLTAVTIGALGYWLYAKSKIINIADKISASILPLVIITALIYAYQLFTTGMLSYYFGKSMGLLLLVAGVFFVPAFTAFVHGLSRYKLHAISIIIIGVSLLSILFVGTNQSIESASQLLQKNSKTSYGVAEEVISYLKNENPKKTKLIILRNKAVNEDYNGNLASKLPHLPMTCAYSVVNKTSSTSLSLKLQNLDTCASKLKNTQLLVITSNETKKQVSKIAEKHPNIEIKNEP